MCKGEYGDYANWYKGIKGEAATNGEISCCALRWQTQTQEPACRLNRWRQPALIETHDWHPIQVSCHCWMVITKASLIALVGFCQNKHCFHYLHMIHCKTRFFILENINTCTFILNFPGGWMLSDRRVPELRITQSTSVTFCMISVIKFPMVQQKAKRKRHCH